MPKAFVLIHIETGKEDEVLQELKELEGVEEAYIVYGGYDIVAKVVADDMDKLKEIVFRHIRKIDAIYSTATLMVTES